MTKKAIIIGAGPAGLTAAYELLKRTDIKPIILEKSGYIGGISKTINYKGNRMDIGGHRFFSKSDRVMNWWLNIMPIQPTADSDTYTTITYQRKHRTIKQEETHTRGDVDDNKVMLVRKRLSRIYFLRKFFTYPIQLSVDTLTKLGPLRTLGILTSYIKARLFQRKPEKSLEDFLINRFGKKLYLLFFKDYTEKVWGVPCNEISAEWGAQRIKGVSISKAMQHAINNIVKKKKGNNDISQKGTETSLIEQFLYPALGPGQLWEEVARQVVEMGGEIYFHQDVKEIDVANACEDVINFAAFTEHLSVDGNISGTSLVESLSEPKNQEQKTINHKLVHSVTAFDSITHEQCTYEGDYFFSTMPVQELIAGMNGEIPEDIKEIAAGLQYRDFITIGVLLKKLTYPDNKDNSHILPDTWIYIQEKDVKVGRLQIFNNWSPFMVKDPDTVWIGMEYFCNKEDEFWNLPDESIQCIAITELEKMGLANVEDVLDSTVQRMEKTYPAYFGTYDQFDKIRAFTDGFENLFLVGRNGMHKYNNSDHSMLTAMVSVDNICEGKTSMENVWEINTEQEYHEEKGNHQSAMSNGHLVTENHNSNLGLLTTEANSKRMETSLSFKDFLFRNKSNRRFIWLAGIAVVLQFAIFKYFYPYPSFIHGDSFIYLEMAFQNATTGTYPIGYPRFLKFFHVFTNSDTVLVAFQYLLIQCSALFLIFSMFYFHKLRKTVQWILWSFVVFNPLFWHLGNLVSSDGLFLALSCVWFTLLLWVIHRPSIKVIILHALVVAYVFMVRYNALVYPLIAFIAFGISGTSIWKKLTGIGLTALLCGLFIFYTGNQYKKQTATWQFSPFSGWQLANNAMYAYRYVDSIDRQPVPFRFKAIDNMVRTYFDSTRDTNKFPYEAIDASTFYMWAKELPLQLYMEQNFIKYHIVDKQLKWASMGPLYTAYGSWLILHYPIQFIQHFILPNAKNYYAPPVEFLEKYNMSTDTVQSIATMWFAYKNEKIKTRLQNSDVHILDFYPIMTAIINVVFFCGLICFLLLKSFKENAPLRKLIILSAAIWSANAGFTIFASPAALRFQAFPILLVITFDVVILNWMVQLMKEEALKMKSTIAEPPIAKKM